MFRIAASLFRLFISLFLYLEIIFLSFLVGEVLESATVSVFLSIFFIAGMMFFRAHATIAFLWGICGFILFFAHANFLIALLMALLLAGVRYGVWKAMAWIRRK